MIDFQECSAGGELTFSLRKRVISQYQARRPFQSDRYRSDPVDSRTEGVTRWRTGGNGTVDLHGHEFRFFFMKKTHGHRISRVMREDMAKKRDLPNATEIEAAL